MGYKFILIVLGLINLYVFICWIIDEEAPEFEEKSHKKAALWVNTALIIAMSLAAGYYNAFKQKNFFVVDKHPEVIVLITEPNQFVARKRDLNTNKMQPDYIILAGDAERPIQLKKVKIENLDWGDTSILTLFE